MSRRNKKLLGEGFPHYMIVDKDGKIVNAEAAGPYPQERLIQQLSSYKN